MSQENKDQQNNHQGKPVLDLTINGKKFNWTHQYILGEEIRKLGNIPKEDLIFLSIKRPWEDEPIMDDTKIDLARPEIEHFFSKEKDQKIVIIVNGREKPWNDKVITFEQLVILAFGSYDNNPNKVYTVTYDRGPHENPEGSMVKGDKVLIKNKMIFNVTATDKS